MDRIDPAGAPLAAVLVIPSWWGLTDSFRRYGAALAHCGYRVGLADLFDGQTATTEAEARALRARRRSTPMYKTLGKDLATLRRHDGGDLAAGLVGFSMGGHWAVWLSQRPEYRISATILYYAARGGDFSGCRAGILAHFAQTDPWVSAGARRSMERALAKAGTGYRACDYPGTTHWFAEADRAGEYAPAAASRALERDRRHLKTCFSGAMRSGT